MIWLFYRMICETRIKPGNGLCSRDGLTAKTKSLTHHTTPLSVSLPSFNNIAMWVNFYFVLSRQNCSCRGESAGFAHISCLVDYAIHQFGTYLQDREGRLCPWEKCPTCLQSYANDLAIDLAQAYVAFTQEKQLDADLHLHAQGKQETLEKW